DRVEVGYFFAVYSEGRIKRAVMSDPSEGKLGEGGITGQHRRQRRFARDDYFAIGLQCDPVREVKTAAPTDGQFTVVGKGQVERSVMKVTSNCKSDVV